MYYRLNDFGLNTIINLTDMRQVDVVIKDGSEVKRQIEISYVDETIIVLTSPSFNLKEVDNIEKVMAGIGKALQNNAV